MPLTIKPSNIKYKNPSTGEYENINSVAEKSSAEMVADINAAGQIKINSINSTGNSYISQIQAKGIETLNSIPVDYTNLNNEVTDLKSAFLQDYTKAEAVPSNADFNDYTTPGTYSVLNSVIAPTVSNMPEQTAGTLSVISVNAVAVMQKYLTYTGLVYTRFKTGSGWKGWVYQGIQTVQKFYETGSTLDANMATGNSIALFNSNATIANFPDGFTDFQNDGTWALVTYETLQSGEKFLYQVIQKMPETPTKRRAVRAFREGSWRNWSIVDGIDTSINVKTNTTYVDSGTLDCNSVSENTIVLFNSGATLTNAPQDFDDYVSDGTWAITTYATTLGGSKYLYQTISKIPENPAKRRAVRAYVSGSWRSWSVVDGIDTDHIRKEIRIGAGQQYSRLRDGIAAAYEVKNADVYVYPGTYDLISEFAEEIEAATGNAGIKLGHNMHVFFYDGAKVTALFDNSQSTYDAETWAWIYNYFQPFYVEFGSFVVENLEIEASNCRYCIHDERGGDGTYRHEYINCRMKYINTNNPAKRVQCIGGGLGKNGTIVIDGGCYESVPNYGIPSTGSDVDFAQIPISFHNGNASGCDSSIYIKNVYLKDKGYFRFGWYGPSTEMSQVQVSGCSAGLPPLLKSETEYNPNARNMELTEFVNEIRNPSHWVLGNDPYYATLVEDN